MTSENERREVARRLRKFASDYGSDGVRAMNRSDANDRLFKAIGFDYLDRANWVYLGDESPDLTPAYAKRLADLIEPQPITGDTSDGYHTFNELYDHRAKLFSVIVRCFKDRAWKSKLHHDGTMYEGMFIVGIETPQGQATYHYDVDPYWNVFDCKELARAPEWDGHTPEQAISRIASLRPSCDRDALLELADEMEQETGSVCGVCMGKTARRIREALGVES